MQHQTGNIMKKDQEKAERESLLNQSNERNTNNNSPNNLSNSNNSNNNGKGYVRISQRILGSTDPSQVKPVTNAPLTADGEDKYLKIQEAALDTKYLMKKNIDKMKDNNESVDHLKETTNLLRQESELFAKNAHELHKGEKRNFNRRRIIIAAACTIYICVVCAGLIFPLIYLLT